MTWNVAVVVFVFAELSLVNVVIVHVPSTVRFCGVRMMSVVGVPVVVWVIVPLGAVMFVCEKLRL